MERVALEAVKRTGGKGRTNELRRKAMVPGVIYGKGYEPVMVSVDEKSLEMAVRTKAGMNVLFDLTIDKKDKVVARIREYQACPIKRNFTHIDFQVVDMTKKMVVEVPLLFEGKSKGVKEGGVLVMDRRSLEVRCLPESIPQHIVVDITELGIGDSIHIDDLKLPDGVECPHEANFGIVSVVAPMKEETAAPAAEATAAEGAAAPAAGAASGTPPGAAPGSAPTAAGTAPASGAKPAAPAKK